MYWSVSLDYMSPSILTSERTNLVSTSRACYFCFSWSWVARKHSNEQMPRLTCLLQIVPRSLPLQSVSQCLYLATLATLATTSQLVRLSVFIPRNPCNPCNLVSVSPSLSLYNSQPLQPRLSQSVSQCLYLATFATLATTSQSVHLSVLVPRNLCNHFSVSLSLCVCISQPLQPLKLRLSEYSSLQKGSLFEAFPKKVYLVYLLTCKFAVCVCRTPRFVWRHVFLSFSRQPPDPYFSLSPYSLSCVSFATFATEIKLPANQWKRSKSFMPTRSLFLMSALW